MEKLRADLHVHTYCSDGLISPEEAVAEAKANGVQLISITDHDCMLAANRAKIAAKKAGIKAVNGLEVSAYEGEVKIHTLGYNVDENNATFKEFLETLRENSFKRAEDIILKLNKNGVKITADEVFGRRKEAKSPVHVMHIAFACAEKGYCGGNPYSFFSEYLAYGKCAHSNILRPTPAEAVEIIAACGGISSLAHPGRIELSKDGLLSLIKKLKACGLGGIEAVYTTHTVTETAYYKETAKAFSLFVTGGSDTHHIGGSRKIGVPEYLNLIHI